MRPALFLLCLFFAHCAISQEILVVDAATREPIFNVAVFNSDKSKSALTDFDGKADISSFSADEHIYFRHVSHHEFRTTKQQIRRNRNIVSLRPSENELQEVILSVDRFGQDEKEVTQKVLSISNEDIIFANPQTSADLLQRTGQVYIQKSQLGGGSPMIRGFATNRLLITVDGVRMNTAIFRGGNVQNIISIDPLSVEQTEVILGPGSVIYGSDAVGGVMNFFTLRPRFSFNEERTFTGSAYTRYATANQEKTGHFDFSIGGEKWAALSSVSYSDFEDLRMGSDGPEEYLRHEYVVRESGQDFIIPNEDPQVQVPTGYQQLNLLQKLRYMPNLDWDFNLGLIFSTTSDYPRYDRLYRKRGGELRAAEWYYGPQTWFQGNFQVSKKGAGDLYDEARFTAAYQFFEESRNDRDFRGDIFYHTREQVDAYSTNLDLEKEFGENALQYGVEYLLNNVNSIGRETNIQTDEISDSPSRYPDGSTWQSIAGYGNFRWSIAERLTLQTGARYNYILLDADFSDKFYEFPFSEATIRTGALTGSAGLNWQQNETFIWKLNLSTAFRAPNIDDVGKIFDSAPGMVVVPNPDLDPEYAYNSELGVQMKFGEVLFLDLSGYYTYLDNALVRRDYELNGETIIDYQGEPSRVQAIQNAARAYVYGFEAGGQLNFTGNLYIRAQLSLTEGKEEQDDGTEANLRHAAPLFGNVHLVWEKERLKFDLFGEYNGEIPYEDLAPTERDKAYLYAIDENGNPYSPEWYTLNFITQYQFADNWQATASLENITDQRYRTYSSGIAAAGRNLILALRYSF